ncbi:MAG: hypothetical protein ACLTS6_15940 [Anaerobutyricum sp.]
MVLMSRYRVTDPVSGDENVQPFIPNGIWKNGLICVPDALRPGTDFTIDKNIAGRYYQEAAD